MERPYVICHILSSLDGKITGPFMGTEAVGALAAAYGKYRTEMNADAWLYGTTTTKEFTDFRRPVLEKAGEVTDGDFIADDRAELYYVSVDVDGEIGWQPWQCVFVFTDAVLCGRRTGRISVKRGGKDRRRRTAPELSA